MQDTTTACCLCLEARGGSAAQAVLVGWCGGPPLRGSARERDSMRHKKLIVVIGGMGTIYGAILGTITYEGLQYFFEHMSEDWMLFMGGAIILMVLLLRKGLAGYLEKLLEK